MNRAPALSAVARARRRSSLMHSGMPKSPRSIVRRTVTGSISRVAAPLPSTMKTGRMSAPIVPKANNTFCAKTKSGIETPLPPSAAAGRASLHGSRLAERTRISANTTSRVASTPTFGRATSTRPQRTTVVPNTTSRSSVPPRPPSEVAALKARLAEIEQENAYQRDLNMDLQTQIEQLRDDKKEMSDQCKLVRGLYDDCKLKQDMLSNSLEVTKLELTHVKESLHEKTELIEKMTEQLNEKEVILRKIHNDVVDLRGQIRVAIRVRPPLGSEKDSVSSIEYPAVNAISQSKTGQQFKFEKVFTPAFSQEEVFVNIEDFLQSALHGYNVGLIAFGQTGSGKTHTMRGGSGELQGVIPRAAKFLFEESKKLERIGWTFEFSLSAMEIYNNDAYDLLNKRAAIKVRLSNGSMALDGLSEHKLTQVGDIWDLLHRSDATRMTAATKCNEHSSRSHAVYMWTIKANQESTGITTTSVLKLVDLAGSERAKESGASGQQFTEMTAINTSLSVLQKCVNLQKSKSKHVPYRDSKLTQVLMDCLGAGNSKTMVIVNINPVSENESKRSIDFAARMRDTHIGSAVQQRDL